jgi:hypothetical protein
MECEAVVREQVRIEWAGTPIGLFFAYDPFHDSCRHRTVFVEFLTTIIPILSAEDIAIFKALYNRAKDWLDIEQLLATQAGAFDASYVRRWIGGMLPDTDPARTRLEALMAQYCS